MSPEEKADNKAAWENTSDFSIGDESGESKPKLTPEQEKELAAFEPTRRLITAIIDPKSDIEPQRAYKYGSDKQKPTERPDHGQFDFKLDNAQWEKLSIALNDAGGRNTKFLSPFSLILYYKEERYTGRMFVLKETGELNISDEKAGPHGTPLQRLVTDPAERMAALLDLYRTVVDLYANAPREETHDDTIAPSENPTE